MAADAKRIQPGTQPGVLDTGEHDAWIWTCVTVPAHRLVAHEKGIYP